MLADALCSNHPRGWPAARTRLSTQALFILAAPSSKPAALMKLRASVVACVSLLASPALLADTALAVRNEASLSRATALPILGNSQVLNDGEQAYGLRVDWSNEYVNTQNARESLLIDAESQRITFGFRQGLAPGVEIGIDVPLLITGGGVLDNVIENWHDAFGLPNGGRQQRPRNRYAVQYVKDGQTLLDVHDSSTDFGDVELNAGFALRDDIAFRAMAKLPTGRDSLLLGGTTGGAIWFDYNPFASLTHWFGYVSAGVSYNEAADQLGGQQKPLVGLGGVGVGYKLIPALALITQFNVQTKLYKGSTLNALDNPGGQLAFGGRISFSRRLALDLGVQEDVLLSSSPDFSIHIGLNYR